ncbi:MAG TPA: hypothetical protein VF731_07335 [Solirubrobacterales bacterium]
MVERGPNHGGDGRVAIAKRGAAVGLLAACVLAIGPSAAGASLPVYEGQAFPRIQSASDPEEFSWEVELGPGQELEQVDEREVAIDSRTGARSWSIVADPAHDATGATVPTTIRVVGEDVVTLTVHHREGNPAAGGAPFAYPVDEGAGWETGPATVEVTGPPDEKELWEQRERQERLGVEEREAAERAKARAERCHVPALRGATLAGARRRLRRANCRLGAISRTGGATTKTSRVVGRAQPPGTSLAPDAPVGVRLGRGPGAH